MQIIGTSIPGLLVLEPTVFRDARGFFQEDWNQRRFQEATGVTLPFVQDCRSRSVRGVLRGLHYQVRKPQGKLVWVTHGSVFDVAVDLRRASPTFGCWHGVELTEDNHRQLWIPPGFGHGFLVTSEAADFVYKATDYYAPEHERCVLWNDPALAIPWPVEGLTLLLSEKDRAGRLLAEAEVFE